MLPCFLFSVSVLVITECHNTGKKSLILAAFAIKAAAPLRTLQRPALVPQVNEALELLASKLRISAAKKSKSTGSIRDTWGIESVSFGITMGVGSPVNVPVL